LAVKSFWSWQHCGYTLYTGYGMDRILLPPPLGYMLKEIHTLCRLRCLPLQSAHHSVNSGWKTHNTKDARNSRDWLTTVLATAGTSTAPYGRQTTHEFLAEICLKVVRATKKFVKKDVNRQGPNMRRQQYFAVLINFSSMRQKKEDKTQGKVK
jgi:hypothetical protein